MTSIALKLACASAFASLAAPAAAAQQPARPDTSAHATCTATATELREQAPDGRKPYAILWSSGALAHDCVIHAFYDASKPPPGESEPRILILRRTAGPLAQPASGRFDSASCAGAIQAARALETFQPLGVKLPALNPSASLEITMDGAYLGLWTTQSRMQRRIGDNTLIAEGWNYPGLDTTNQSVRTALKDCKPSN